VTRLRASTPSGPAQGRNHAALRAKGFTGGCNAGQLGSWGGKITIKVALD
jgi:hypothetical protein